jgi:hypothetical protein
MIGVAGSSSSGDAGTFNNGGSEQGASGSGGGGSGSNSTAGTFSNSGTFSNGGSTLGGSTFGASGSGGTAAGSGGTTAGSGGAMGGTGGKAAGGSGGAAAGAGGKAAGGNAGTGGTGPVAGCPAKNTWTATASVEASDCTNPDSAYCGPPARAIDDVPDNRYTTGVARQGTEWLQIDFKVPTTVKSLTLNTAAGSGDYTLAYAVRMSNDAVDIGNTTAIVTGTGQKGATVITFPAAKTGRYLRVNQTMAMDGWWSVAEISVVCE